jgi:hypothetical protein
MGVPSLNFVRKKICAKMVAKLPSLTVGGWADLYQGGY